jgi:hypothetical protein
MNIYHKKESMKPRSIFVLPVLIFVFIGFVSCISWAKTSDGINNAKKAVVTVMRDPFWPVGYQPINRSGDVKNVTEKVLTASNGSTDWNAAMKQVVINGVSSRGGNEYVAVINNEVKMVGETISIFYGGTQYSWIVQSITPPKSVQLRRVSVK